MLLSLALSSSATCSKSSLGGGGYLLRFALAMLGTESAVGATSWRPTAVTRWRWLHSVFGACLGRSNLAPFHNAPPALPTLTRSQ
eukprot:2680872-Rhodomonas_salina.1